MRGIWLAQAAVEYILIMVTQAAAFLGSALRSLGQFVSTPRGIVVAAIVVGFLALSLMWRKPPRM
ncbi:MAG TPA: hypothetical protein VJU15_07570 [Gemmatimonadales bacterium]|nr:hypothetical protein [Gemmatimonadales bacterium]